jgi:hypothetical protein
MNVQALQDYLTVRGISVSGYKKIYNKNDSKIADGYGKCDFLALEDDSIVLKDRS